MSDSFSPENSFNASDKTVILFFEPWVTLSGNVSEIYFQYIGYQDYVLINEREFINNYATIY